MNATSNIDIEITAAAENHIRNQLQLTQANFLRLGVKESGCNGYMYTLDFLDSPDTDDICIDFGEAVKICISSNDTDLVHGTVVDMITQGLNSALVFKNPNAVSYCGCGESFAVAERDDSVESLDPDSLATDIGC